MTTKLEAIGQRVAGNRLTLDDCGLLLTVAEAAAAYSKWRIEIQRFDVDTNEWPIIAANLRTAEIALMAAIASLMKENDAH